MAQINQPMYILRDDTERYQGNQALRMNILASQILASIVRTTLGPKGMDKMLVDKKMGDVVVTNDGATILQEMDIAHPAAKMLVEIARKQEHVVGDGTTTVVIIAGELLKKAQELYEDGTAIPTILMGYRLAVAKAMEILFDISTDARDKDTLFAIAKKDHDTNLSRHITSHVRDGSCPAYEGAGRKEQEERCIGACVDGAGVQMWHQEHR